MTKINMKDFEKRMKELLDEFGSAKTLREVGEYTADRIRKRTKLGKGVKKEFDEATPLKKLSKGYVKARKNSKKLDGSTSAGRSNLTFTGQMLRALKVIRVEPGVKVVIDVEDSSRKEGNANNNEVAGFVSKDRPFLNVSKAELAGIQSLIRKILKRFIA